VRPDLGNRLSSILNFDFAQSFETVEGDDTLKRLETASRFSPACLASTMHFLMGVDI
jgi:hypothetical protein